MLRVAIVIWLDVIGSPPFSMKNKQLYNVELQFPSKNKKDGKITR